MVNIRKKLSDETRFVRSDSEGFFGAFGGSYVAEILRDSIEELQRAYYEVLDDETFFAEFSDLTRNYAGRPTPLTFADNLTKALGGPQIYLKREDLNHTGSHKLNNALGQALVARRLGKTRLIAETGAGQHGVATATAAAKLGFQATIYMGETDVERQYPNVFWMQRLGATVVPVRTGGGVLKDAIDEALRDWAGSFADTHYLLGTTCGPHPYPALAAVFQSIVGSETREAVLSMTGRLPKAVYACVGGGSNATGIFQGFLDDESVELIGVEAGGDGDAEGRHASRIAIGGGIPGVAQGYRTFFIQNEDGQLSPTHSVAAGLDYVGISPILADLADRKRVRFTCARDAEVVEAVAMLTAREGIIPALESAHAVAALTRESGQYTSDDVVVVNVSGRGDKDIFTVAGAFGDEGWYSYLRKLVKENSPND